MRACQENFKKSSIIKLRGLFKQKSVGVIMEGRYVPENSNQNYLRFLIQSNPSFYSELSRLLGKGVDEFTPSELLDKLVTLTDNDYAIKLISENLTVFSAYMIELLKDFSVSQYEFFYTLFLGQRILEKVGAWDSLKDSLSLTRGVVGTVFYDFRNEVIEGNFDDKFYKPLFELLGANFFQKQPLEQARQLSHLKNAIYEHFRQYPEQAKYFISNMVDLPDSSTLYRILDHPEHYRAKAERDWLPALMELKSNFEEFMSPGQQGIVEKFGRAPQVASVEEQAAPRTPEALQPVFQQREVFQERVREVEESGRAPQVARVEEEAAAQINPELLVLPEKQIEKIEPRLQELGLPEIFKDAISLNIMRDPIILSTGQSSDRSSIQDHFLTCYNEGKPPTDPISNVKLYNILRKPDEIPLVRNILLLEIIHVVVAITERHSEQSFDKQELVNLIEPFIRSFKTKELFEEPVVVLRGKLSGQTFEKAELLARLKKEEPGLDEDKLVKKYNIVTNWAIKKLVDEIKELKIQLEAAPGLSR